MSSLGTPRRELSQQTCLTGGRMPCFAKASSLWRLQEDQCPRRQEPEGQDLSRPPRNRPSDPSQIQCLAAAAAPRAAWRSGVGARATASCCQQSRHHVDSRSFAEVGTKGLAGSPSQGARRLGRARAGGEILLPFGLHQWDNKSFSSSCGLRARSWRTESYFKILTKKAC